MSNPNKKPKDDWEGWLDHLECGDAPFAWQTNIREVIEGYQEVIERLKTDIPPQRTSS